MRTVLLVPGGGEGLHSRNYGAVLKAIEARGYKTEFVPISWSRTTIDKWVPELMETYKEYDPADTILAGFSWGAMTAFAAAAQRSPAELWLFSLSPYFSEDIPSLKLWWLRNIGKQRAEVFRRISFDALCPAVTCPVKLFAGEKEMRKWPETARRFREAGRKFRRCTAVTVPGTGHEIDHMNYIAAIKENI